MTSATDLAALERELASLEEEFSRLNSDFAANLKALGLTEAELRAGKLTANPPPSLKARLEEARAAARRVGTERAGQRQTLQTQVERSPARRLRAGVIRP